MNISIVSVCYNGYGKFIPNWLKMLDELKQRPNRIVLVLGDNPGDFPILPNNIHLLHATGTNLGHLKNLAVSCTNTEWVMSMSLDDEILPNALNEFEKHQDGDIIICPFYERTKEGEKLRTPKPTRLEILSGILWLSSQDNFFHGSVPFRRKLWEEHPYQENDCFNSLFWIDCALSNAKFTIVDTPCLVYNRLGESHSCISNNITEEDPMRHKRKETILGYKQKERGIVQPKLSIFMIVKNEEEMLEDALKTIKDADEIVVCDTGSTDRTIEIAKKYTDKVFTDYKWNDDFAEAKNHAASKCTGDWVMSLDADCRLEKGGIEKIRDIISRTPHQVVNVKLTPVGRPDEFHFRGKIYRNNGEIFYQGRAHEDLNMFGKDDYAGVMPVIYYDYSPNHKKDPDRYIRILTKQLKENPKSARPLFYLAREYYYKKDYATAIKMFERYLDMPTFWKEKVEALYMLAQMYWWTLRGDQAREICLKAIGMNPDDKKVLLLMAEMHYEPYKSKWLKIANQAENKDVMFAK